MQWFRLDDHLRKYVWFFSKGSAPAGVDSSPENCTKISVNPFMFLQIVSLLAIFFVCTAVFLSIVFSIFHKMNSIWLLIIDFDTLMFLVLDLMHYELQLFMLHKILHCYMFCCLEQIGSRFKHILKLLSLWSPVKTRMAVRLLWC